jgi:hypothetical protein
LDIDPQLGPLQDNGGQSWTMALLPGSPAIDSGNNLNAPDWDQRGPGFPRIVNGTIDRGAFEVQNAAGPAGDRGVLLTVLPVAAGAAAAPAPQTVTRSRRAARPTAGANDAPLTARPPAAPVSRALRAAAPAPNALSDPFGWDML